MPPKYETEDYDRCLKSTDKLAVYCGVRTIIKPDENNELWHLIMVIIFNLKNAL